METSYVSATARVDSDEGHVCKKRYLVRVSDQQQKLMLESDHYCHLLSLHLEKLVSERFGVIRPNCHATINPRTAEIDPFDNLERFDLSKPQYHCH